MQYNVGNNEIAIRLPIIQLNKFSVVLHNDKKP